MFLYFFVFITLSGNPKYYAQVQSLQNCAIFNVDFNKDSYNVTLEIRCRDGDNSITFNRRDWQKITDLYDMARSQIRQKKEFFSLIEKNNSYGSKKFFIKVVYENKKPVLKLLLIDNAKNGKFQADFDSVRRVNLDHTMQLLSPPNLNAKKMEFN